MDSDPLERYRSMARRVHAPRRLPDRVMEQSRVLPLLDSAQQGEAACVQERGTAKGPRHTKCPTPIFAGRGRRRLGGFAVAAGIVLALGAGILVAEPFARSPEGPGSATQMSEQDSPLQPFGLAVANAAEAGQSVDLSPNESGIRYVADGGTYFLFRMNLTCVGTGIDHLTYTIKGDDVSFMALEGRPTDPAVSSPSQFEVDYRDQSPDNLSRELYVSIEDPAVAAIDAQLASVDAEIKASGDRAETESLKARQQSLLDEQAALENAFYEPLLSGAVDENTFTASSAAKAAHKLSQATLSVTASFTGGGTETKNYRIAPVEQFEQRFRDYLDAAFASGRDDADPRLNAPFFTISEVP